MPGCYETVSSLISRAAAHKYAFIRALLFDAIGIKWQSWPEGVNLSQTLGD
jgi:hypothetical protein